ncbi:hypothetical protein [Kitasatospora sp. NPDC088783]|uniref:hypothetical protein n=1 Tax=Kitasatospora sp. NPDC088783 TaxID=3364077 RepID=UPI00380E028C
MPERPAPHFAVTLHRPSLGRPVAVEDAASLAGTLGLASPPTAPLCLWRPDGAAPVASVVPLDLLWRPMAGSQVRRDTAALAGTSWWLGAPGRGLLHQSRFTADAVADIVSFLADRGELVALAPHVIAVTDRGVPAVYLPERPPAAWARAQAAPTAANVRGVARVLARAGLDPAADRFALTGAAEAGQVLLHTADPATVHNAQVALEHTDDYTVEQLAPGRFAVRTATTAEIALHRAAPEAAWLPVAALRPPGRRGPAGACRSAGKSDTLRGLAPQRGTAGRTR